MKRYRKLVRDNIPEIIRKRGASPVSYTLNYARFMIELRKKLVEEAKEVATAHSRENLLEELGDLYLVFETIVHQSEFTLTEVKEASHKKSREVGYFDKRIFLEEINE